MSFRDTLSTMPPLHHTLPSQAYATERSQVIAWITAQPGFLEWVFQKARDTGRIQYNPETGKWHGVTKRRKAEPGTRAPKTPVAPTTLTEEL